MTVHWNGNVSTNELWHWRLMTDRPMWCLTDIKKVSHRESVREEKGCKSKLAFLSLCPKLVLSRGGPSGKSAGTTASQRECRIATYFWQHTGGGSKKRCALCLRLKNRYCGFQRCWKYSQIKENHKNLIIKILGQYPKRFKTIFSRSKSSKTIVVCTGFYCCS